MATRRSDQRSRRPSTGRRDVRSTRRNTSNAKGPAAISIAGTRFTSRAIILLAVALLLIASYTSSVHAWWQQRAEITALERQKEQLAGDIDELKDLQTRWNDPAFINQQARARFGWVMPGEVGYRVIGSDGTLQGDASQLTRAPGTEAQPWQDKLWGTFEQAGRDPAAEIEPEVDGPDPDEILRDPEQ